MRTVHLAVFLGAICFSGTIHAESLTGQSITINTLAPNGGSGVINQTPSGQTFTVPPDGPDQIISFTYWLGGSGGSVPARAEMYAFNPATLQVSGPALYVSDSFTVAQSFPAKAYTFDFDPIPLSQNGQYLVALLPDYTNVPDHPGLGFAWGVMNTYADGAYRTVSIGGVPPFIGATWGDVSYARGADVAFTATLVPDPTAVPIPMLCGIALLARRRSHSGPA